MFCQYIELGVYTFLRYGYRKSNLHYKYNKLKLSGTNVVPNRTLTQYRNRILIIAVYNIYFLLFLSI